MNLFVSNELRLTVQGLYKNQPVNQHGHAQANIDRFQTPAFTDFLTSLSKSCGIQASNIYYADHYNGQVEYSYSDAQITAQNGRSCLRFQMNDDRIRDFQCCVNPDGSTYILIRHPMEGRRNGLEKAFPTTEEGIKAATSYLCKQYGNSDP